jgi:hypothetical protein
MSTGLITSITAWRKALRQGDTLRVVNHDAPQCNGIRPVLRVQGNAFTTLFVRSDGEEVETWSYYLPAKQMRLSPDGRTLTKLDQDGNESISYTVLEGAAADPFDHLLDTFEQDLAEAITPPFKVDWQDASTVTYSAESAVINDHVVTVCLDDEGPLTPAFYWDLRALDDDSDAVASDWAPSVAQAKDDAVMAAMRLPA